MRRHHWALMALNTTAGVELCMYLKGAVLECTENGEIPYMDPAVRLIANQVAFALNGDIHVSENRDKFIKHCEAMILASPNYHKFDEAVPGENKLDPSTPTPKVPSQ